MTDEKQTTEWSLDQWESAVRAVFQKTLFDPAFRSLALQDPAAAMEQAFGERPPEHYRFRFVGKLEENVFVLPSLSVAPDRLSPKDLSRVLYHAYKPQAQPPAC